MLLSTGTISHLSEKLRNDSLHLLYIWKFQTFRNCCYRRFTDRIRQIGCMVQWELKKVIKVKYCMLLNFYKPVHLCNLLISSFLYRYIGDSIKGSITVLRKANPGAQVPIKLCHFVRAKCHPMLYDLRINSPSTIRLNAYQAFLLCAMKFHAYLCSMERTCHHHSPFLLQAIEFTPR